MITLYQFHRVWGIPNASPFCVKVETFLRMAKIPYEIAYVRNPQKAPKGKLPYIKMDGEKYADSELIIDTLKKRFDLTLDAHLTAEQQALAVLIDNVFAERLYWIMLYLRWQDDVSWMLLNKEFFGHLPAWMKLFLPALVRKKMLTALHCQGTGRHSKEEVVHLGIKSADALSCLLGKQSYFLGERPSSVDATAFGFLVNALACPIRDPLSIHVAKMDNIRAYCRRMWEAFYPDMPLPDSI